LMQIPFDAEINAESGYTKTYKLLLHFKTHQDYSSKEILELVVAQFQKMGMDLGEILKPIAYLCSAKGTKPWNGMIKMHLQNPTTNRQALVSGMRVFLLTLGNEIRVPKVAKGYNNLAPNGLLTVTTSSPNLCSIPQHEILTEITVINFCRG
jgi:hypothetical protein